jgi:hypothetical protein
MARGATHLGLSKVLRPWFSHAYKKMIAKASQPVDYDSKVPKIHARFGYKSFPNTIGFQRRIFMEKCFNNNNVITGSVKPGAYNKEVKKMAAVLSPYGWGEICFRDFEAVINGALLIKPNMDHIETWPDIYQCSRTYLPIDWDGNDLVTTIDRVSANMKDYVPIAEKAKEVYKSSLLNIDNKVLSFLEEAAGKTINVS